MKDVTWQSYAEKWPEELSKAQEGLKSDIARGIYVYLLLNENKSFSDMAKVLELEPNKLAYHLKNLVRYGLLTHEYMIKEGINEHSFYKISNFGNIYAKKALEAAHSPYQHQDISVSQIHFKDKPEEGIPFPIGNWTSTNEGNVYDNIRIFIGDKPLKKRINNERITTTEVVI